MNKIVDRLWHKLLGRPYRLRTYFDSGAGVPVILLHGIGKDGEIWQSVAEGLPKDHYRVIAFDLLGFGGSPKPDWLHYDIDDHVDALVASIKKLKLKQPAVVAGHSMGALIAVRLAALHPEMVRHLILYEMPLYDGWPEKRRYRLRLNFYYALYKRIIKFQPPSRFKSSPKAKALAEKVTGYKLSEPMWLAFVRSLENTIMNQSTAAGLKTLPMPVEMIYGTRDFLVIRGEIKEIFGEDVDNVVKHTIKESHAIRPKSSRFLVERIRAATEIIGYEHTEHF